MHKLYIRLFLALIISTVLSLIVGHYFRELEITKEATHTTYDNNSGRSISRGNSRDSGRSTIHYSSVENLPFNISLAIITGILCFSTLGMIFVIMDKKDRKSLN